MIDKRRGLKAELSLLMRFTSIFLLLLITFAPGCTIDRDGADRPASNTAIRSDNSTAATAKPADAPAEADARAAAKIMGSNAERELCYQTDTGDNVVLKSQTFAIDFEPFRSTCFVTEHNPEYDDPPMDSEIAIYRKGKRLYGFPNQFNGVTTGCWVEAVGFQDLNSDQLIDVIVIGKCSAKSAPYNENMVYVNTGKAFTTNEDANTKASEFTTVKAVVGYVTENREIFFKQ